MDALRTRPVPWLAAEISLLDWPSDWVAQLISASHRGSAAIKTHGRGPGSLEDDSTAGLDYRVLTGKALAETVPWLTDWYLSIAASRMMSHYAGESVRASPDLGSGINVNMLTGPGGRYEWHTDAQPYTLLLFATTLAPSQGGQLQIGTGPTPMEHPFCITPRVGHGVFFDGSVLPHAVAPLTDSVVRISLPMVFLPVDEPLQRDPGLDSYLFTPEQT